MSEETDKDTLPERARQLAKSIEDGGGDGPSRQQIRDLLYKMAEEIDNLNLRLDDDRYS